MYEFRSKTMNKFKEIVVDDPETDKDARMNMAYANLGDSLDCTAEELQDSDWEIEETIELEYYGYKFRKPTPEELQDIFYYWVKEIGYDEATAFRLLATHTYVVIPEYASDSPGYCGKIILAVHCDCTFYEAYIYYKGKIELIPQEPIGGNFRIEFGEDHIRIYDINNKEVVGWTVDEWKEDPNLVLVIANAVKLAKEGRIQERLDSVDPRYQHLNQFPVGTKVTVKTTITKFDHFEVPVGTTGTVDFADKNMISIRMDQKIKGAEYWDNCVHFYQDERPEVTIENYVDILKEV